MATFNDDWAVEATVTGSDTISYSTRVGAVLIYNDGSSDLIVGSPDTHGTDTMTLKSDDPPLLIESPNTLIGSITVAGSSIAYRCHVARGEKPAA